VAELTPPPVSEWELWACAQETIRQHGEKAAGHATARIETLEAQGATRGAVTWRLIRDRIAQLQEEPAASNES
jgi:hypothetical protein